MKQGVIYKITSPFGRIYIGKTVHFKNRINSYRNNHNSAQHLIYRSIKKYGWENHLFEIIHYAPVNELDEWEIKYIHEYNSFYYDNPSGMNLTKGGGGTLGVKQSEETRKNRALKRIGTKHTDATKKLMSELKKGKAPSGAFYTRTEKHLEILRQNSLNRKVSTEEIEQRKVSRLNRLIEQHESVLQMDMEGNIIKEWVMLPKYICKTLNYSDDTGIVKCLNGRQSSYKGYKWTYKK